MIRGRDGEDRPLKSFDDKGAKAPVLTSVPGDGVVERTVCVPDLSSKRHLAGQAVSCAGVAGVVCPEGHLDHGKPPGDLGNIGLFDGIRIFGGGEPGGPLSNAEAL